MSIFKRKRDPFTIFNYRGDPEEKKEKEASKHLFYEKFFEGYYPIETVSKNGKLKIKQFYMSSYYAPKLGKKAYLIRRILYAVMLVGYCAAFAFLATIRCNVNSTFYATVCHAMHVLTAAWMLTGIFNSFVYPFKKTIYEWKSSSKRLIKGSIAAAISSLVTVVMYLIHSLLISFFDKQALLIGLGFAVPCAIAFVINRLEANLEYNIIPNENITELKNDN